MVKLKYRFEEILVAYKTYGNYRMATREDPEEYPEVVIYEVYFNNVDILPILSETDQDEIYELLNEYLYG